MAEVDVMVVNVPPYQGEYEFDWARQLPNTDEWEVIYKVSGYLPLTIEEGFKGGDPRLFVAFSVIAMERAGKINADEMYDVAAFLRKAPVDGTGITYRAADREEEEAPPLSGSESSDEKPSSGDDSSPPSEPSPEKSDQPTSGIQDWATGSDSDHLTLAK